MLQSNSPTTLMFPPFRGATRRIVLFVMACFVGLMLLGSTPWFPQLSFWLMLMPVEALLGKPWQLVTYALVPMSLFGTLFALLSIWVFGAQLEEERGPRWLTEYVLVSGAGGALLASGLAFLHIPGINPLASAAGLYPVVMALLLAFARMYPDQTLSVFGIIPVKAKYLAAAYLLLYLISTLTSGNGLQAAVALCAAFCGFLYLRFTPRRGLGFAASEGWFGARNAYYRSKRRRAAKKFTVYMKKQGKDVSLDPSGRYVGLDDERRDPKDKRWMN